MKKDQRKARPQALLVCTQLLKRSLAINKATSNQIKSTSLSLKNNNFKDQFTLKSKCQLQVKGIKLSQSQKQTKLNNQIKSTKKSCKMKTPWFGQVPNKLNQKRTKQNLISAEQVKSNTQLISFYQKNVFLGSNQYKRFNRLLRNKYLIQAFKAEDNQQSLDEVDFILKQRSNTSPKRYLYETSKFTDRESSSNSDKMVIQMFDPRLKYKRRPSSGDPLKRYKMSSMLARRRRGSVCDREKTINLQLGHIEPLKYFEDNKEQNIKEQAIKQQVIREQTMRNDVKPKNRIILKTEPSFRRSSMKQKQLRSSGHQINPWSDEEWRAKNIVDEQIHVKLLP